MHDVWWLTALLLIMILISVFDVKSKTIPRSAAIGLLILAVAYRIISEDWTWYTILISVLPGIVLGLVSFITGGKVGLGDAIIIAILGIGMGVERCMFSFMAALLISSLFSLVLLIFGKATKKTEIPFMPFLTLGIGAMAYVIR